MSSPREESAVSATTGETRVGVSSAATELSLRLSNNFRDVKFDTNYIAACNSHLKQSRAITGLFTVTNRYREIKKKFATRDNLVSREVRTDKVQSSIEDLYIWYVLKLSDSYDDFIDKANARKYQMNRKCFIITNLFF